MRHLLPTLALLMTIAPVMLGQTVVYIDDNNPATGTSNTFPWAQTGGFTTLHVYNAAQLAAGGVCAGAMLTDFAVAPSSGTSGTYNAPTAKLSIGHLVSSPPTAGAWEANLATPTVVHSLTSGPYTFPWTLNTWTSLPGVAAAGFIWDGIRDIAVFYTSSAGVTGTFNAHRTGTNLRHAVAVFNATTQAPTSNGLFAMKARLTWAGGAALYQTNQAASTLSIDGVNGFPCSPARVTKCFGVAGTVNFQSSLAGNGWELVLTIPEPLAPLGAGGLLLPASGQIVNVNLFAPSLTFLNNLLFPPFVAASLPFAAAVPVNLTAQMAVLDPTNPDALALSGGNELHVLGAGVVAGPAGDDVFTTHSLGVAPLCGPASVAFYGVSYTQLFVSSNGRVTFGAGSTSISATTAAAMAAPAFAAGAWCDLDPSIAGSSVTVAVVGPAVRVTYLNVPYFGLTVTNTFAIEFDSVTGWVKLDGLAGIGVHPTAGVSLLGISKGLGATDPGMTAFSPTGSGVTTNGTAMLYQLGASGTLTPGINSITFIPNGFTNYDWFSL